MTSAQITQPTQPGACSGSSGPACSAPTIVQSQFNSAASNANSATMTSAPTNGNLLIAFGSLAGAPGVASGWTSINTSNAGTDYATIAFKIAGASESTTQTPFSNTGAGSVGIYEIATAGYSFNAITDASSETPNANLTVQRAGGMIIGAFARPNTTLPTGITGATADGTSNTNSSIAGFHVAAPVAGANDISASYSTSADTKGMAIALY